MRRTGIIWDMGGTLVLRMTLEPDFVKRAFRETGLRPAPLSPEALAQIGAEWYGKQNLWPTVAEERAGFRAMARAFLGGAAAADADVARLGERLAHYYDVYAPVPGIRALLDDLAARRIPMAVVSEWPPSLRAFLAHHDLSRYFEAVVCSAEEGILKPDPRLIERALVHLQMAPEQVIYIGDHPAKDIEPAQSLGLRTIHFNPRRMYAAETHEVDELRGQLEALLAG